MKISKYSHLKSNQIKASSIVGGGGGSSSTTIEGGGRAELDRTIWGQNDTGEDIDGSMVINGNVNINVINNSFEEDDADAEYEEYEEGGGNLNVELTTTTKDLEVNNNAYIKNHLYINYNKNHSHSENKKCVGEILNTIETNVETNKNNITSNLTEINALKSRVSTNENNISTNSEEIEKLKNRTANTENVISSFTDVMPIGSIIMYNGLSENLPENWVICDGNNGTPNLVDKFIRASNVVGETGGRNSVYLTYENLPPHKHYFKNYLTQVNGDGEINVGKITIDNEECYVMKSQIRDKNPTRRAQTSDSSYSNIPYIFQQTEQTGSDTPMGFSILPSYYSLIFIMKIK